MVKHRFYYYSILIVVTLVLVVLSVGVGFGTWQSPNTLDSVVLNIRLPRIGSALLVGASLAAAGAALQALFENPLADPSLIGTSGGAALGVIIILAAGVSGIGVPVAAFLGALGVCLLILGIHKVVGGGTFGLLIMGLILSSFCAAIVSLILFLSDDLVLRSATIWLSGSLAESGFVSPFYALFAAILGLFLVVLSGRKLDCLMLGEDTAYSMGINIDRLRIQTVVGAALLTAGAVSLSGIIGFLGMMIPNILTAVVGGERHRIILLSAWAGAVFLLTIDTIARWTTYPVDVPVGIIISLLGGPFFLWLFLKSIHTRKAA